MSEIGWGWPGLSRKAHVFSDARALCGGWMFTGKLDPFVATDKPGPDDCKACWKKALKAAPLAAEGKEKTNADR